MPPPSLPPIILRADRGAGGELLVRLRLSDGRVGECYLPAGELTEQLLAELDPLLVAQLTPRRALFG
jgi:hypothetical protein